jgi:class 3 adenylate cyclase
VAGPGRLASFSRPIVFDERSSGRSDHAPGPVVLEGTMRDVLAVLDATGAGRPAVCGDLEGAALGALFAATHPGTHAGAGPVRALVRAPAATTSLGAGARAAGHVRRAAAGWLGQRAHGQDAGGRGGAQPRRRPAVPNLHSQGAAQQRQPRELPRPGCGWSARSTCARPSRRSACRGWSCTRGGDRAVEVGASRDAAGRIPGARLVGLPDGDNLPLVGDAEAVAAEVEEFLTGSVTPPTPDRVLATTLCTDIAGSTERAAELGDRRWRELLGRHDALARAQLGRYRGREVTLTGGGLLATFDGPARAVTCAAAIGRAVRTLGLEVRAAVHAGEVELRDGDVGGIAVHVASRVMGLARPNEVLVSSTVKDLVAGGRDPLRGPARPPLRGCPATGTCSRRTPDPFLTQRRDSWMPTLSWTASRSSIRIAAHNVRR